MMPRVRRRKIYQHVSDFDRGHVVTYRNCGLSHRSTAACVSRNVMIVCRIWNLSFLGGHMVRLAGFQWLAINSSLKGSHLIGYALMNITSVSRSLSQEMGSFARHQASAPTIR